MAGLLSSSSVGLCAPRQSQLFSRSMQISRTSHSQRLVVKAQQQPGQPGPLPGLDTILQVSQFGIAIGCVRSKIQVCTSQHWAALHLQRLGKYDFVSTGLGAAAVTSVCVAQGQDPFFALALTVCATVAALVSKQYSKMAFGIMQGCCCLASACQRASLALSMINSAFSHAHRPSTNSCQRTTEDRVSQRVGGE